MRQSLLLALVLLVACPNKKAPIPASDAPVSSVSVGPGSGPMHERLAHVTAARDALIAGKVDEARQALVVLADESSPAVAPESWQGPMQDLLESASAGAEAESAADVARAIAQAGRACGSCHDAAGGGPIFVAVPTPAADDIMTRHIWASDRMWESLIGPNPTAWTQAHEAMGQVKGTNTDLYEGVPLAVQGEAAQHRVRLHGLIEAGTVGASSSDRADLYGAALETCVNCHALLGGGPR